LEIYIVMEKDIKQWPGEVHTKLHTKLAVRKMTSFPFGFKSGVVFSLSVFWFGQAHL